MSKVLSDEQDHIDILSEDQLNNISMENDEEIVSRLKFIGYIQKDEKINVKYLSRQSNTWITTLSRTVFYPDNRNNTLIFLRNVISRSFTILRKFIRHKDILLAQGIIKDFIRCQVGLHNLKHTYSDDTKFCCDIVVLIQNIQTNLSKLKILNEKLFPAEEESS